MTGRSEVKAKVWYGPQAAAFTKGGKCAFAAGARVSMARADIHSATEQVFVLRCGRRLRAHCESGVRSQPGSLLSRREMTTKLHINFSTSKYLFGLEMAKIQK